MPKYLLACLAILLFAAPAMAVNDTPVDQKAPVTKSARLGGGIMRFDINKDGVVEQTEWKAAQQKRFRRLDTNHDGKLSEDELVAGAKSGNDRQELRRAAAFKRLDADKNGSVTVEEFLAQRQRIFVRCDGNRDGRTNLQECDAQQRKGR